MNKKILILSVILVGLSLISCSKNSGKSTKTTMEAVSNTESATGSDASQKKNTASEIFAKPQIPVICFHRIEDGKKGEYTVSSATFAADIKILADSGYHSISPAQLYDYLVYNKPLPSKPVVISFDDSRVEHSKIAAPTLEKYGFRGVFFIMTITYNKKNYMTTEEIASLAKAGHTIGLHSWDHQMTIKYKTPADWQKEVVEPLKKLEKIVGKPVEYWAYPNGVFNHESEKELAKYFKISFELSSKRDPLFPLQSVKRMLVTECKPQQLLKYIRRNF